MAVVDADLLLLERFCRHRDEEAFAQRVRQHAPLGYRGVDGRRETAVSGTRTAGNVPAMGNSDVMWVRIVSDGSTVTVQQQLSATEPGSWSGVSNCYSSGNFPLAGGGFAVAPQLTNGRIVALDDLTLRTDRDANGSYETTEHVERFTVDSTGNAPTSLTHDAAGNLTYDGRWAYAYDAWNKLATVHKAYREATDNGSGGVTLGSVQLGSQTARYQYDGQQRRIVREITHSGVLDATYHDYLREQSVIETRNGSDLVLQQWVWGLDYIDELVHAAVNADPLDDTEGTGTQSLCERHYVALHNANYNVLGIAIANAAALSAHSDGSGGYAGALGELVERYEYTPYGQRTCYLRPGSNDELCQSPRPTSAAVGTTDLGRQPYGLNPLGHQGLWHDEAVAGGAEVYNRARHLHPGLGRFAQRDPLGYVDGMNVYLNSAAHPSLRDPNGTEIQGPIKLSDGVAVFHVYNGGHWIIWPLWYSDLEYIGSVYFNPDSAKRFGDDTIASEAARWMDSGGKIKDLAARIEAYGTCAELVIRMTNQPLDAGLSIIEFGENPSLYAAAAAALPFVPGGGFKITKYMRSRQKVIARGDGIRDIDRLINRYGGAKKKWKKMKTWDEQGIEWHWYENPEVGWVEPKTK